MPQLSKIDESYLDDLDISTKGSPERNSPTTSVKEPSSHDVDMIGISIAEDSTRAEIAIMKNRNQDLDCAFSNLQAQYSQLLATHQTKNREFAAYLNKFKAEHNQVLAAHQTLRSALKDLKVKDIQQTKARKAMAEEIKQINVNYSNLQSQYSSLTAENTKLRQQCQQFQRDAQQIQLEQDRAARTLEVPVSNQHEFLVMNVPMPESDRPEGSPPAPRSRQSTQSTADPIASSEEAAVSSDRNKGRGEQDKFDKTSRKWLCSMCGKYYTRREHLHRHQNSVHLHIKPFVCTFCDHSTARKDRFQRHMRSCHPGMLAQSELERADSGYL